MVAKSVVYLVEMTAVLWVKCLVVMKVDQLAASLAECLVKHLVVYWVDWMAVVWVESKGSQTAVKKAGALDFDLAAWRETN